MKRVTIVGAGFAALTAIQKLRKAAPAVEITVVAPKPEFTYLPGTIWIPSGIREPEDLLIPLDSFFCRQKV
ncbi:MAG: NAD(P)/FAD-dependent oxidoreductase, partial [Chromatiales bacterium]|nr:NAD(P)/FAD-dependent oxidoreductase [Chromatiales bacterium]